eukprot:442280_1
MHPWLYNILLIYVRYIEEICRRYVEDMYLRRYAAYKIHYYQPYPLTGNTHVYEHQKKGAEQLKYLFEHYGEKEWILLLNRYSKDYICSNDDKKFDLKYGDCIHVANNTKPLVQSLTSRYRYTVAQKEKHTLLSAFVSVDDDGKVVNDQFLYDLTNGKINKTLIDKVGKFGLKYDNGDSVHLYDKKFDGKPSELLLFNKILITIMEDRNIQEALINVDNSANASPLEEININVQFHGIRGTSYEHNQTNPY